MESDIRYYSRRACEEMAAANRAVTEAARERRLQLVDMYVAAPESTQRAQPVRRTPISPSPRLIGRQRSELGVQLEPPSISQKERAAAFATALECAVPREG